MNNPVAVAEPVQARAVFDVEAQAAYATPANQTPTAGCVSYLANALRGTIGGAILGGFSGALTGAFVKVGQLTAQATFGGVGSLSVTPAVVGGATIGAIAYAAFGLGSALCGSDEPETAR